MPDKTSVNLSDERIERAVRDSGATPEHVEWYGNPEHRIVLRIGPHIGHYIETMLYPHMAHDDIVAAVQIASRRLDNPDADDDNDVRAALRDASFFGSARFAESRAQPSYVPTYHVVGHPSGYYLSACGRLLDAGTETNASGVMHRCQRSGCRQRWPHAR